MTEYWLSALPQMVSLTAMGSQHQLKQSGSRNLDGGQGKKGTKTLFLLKIICCFLFKVSGSLDLVEFEERNKE